MRAIHLVATAAVLVAGIGAASAAGRGLGGGGRSATPPGFGSQGGHKGFQAFSNTTTDANGQSTTTSSNQPSGWDQGKADWKSGLQGEQPRSRHPSAGAGPKLSIH